MYVRVVELGLCLCGFGTMYSLQFVLRDQHWGGGHLMILATDVGHHIRISIYG